MSYKKPLIIKDLSTKNQLIKGLVNNDLENAKVEKNTRSTQCFE